MTFDEAVQATPLVAAHTRPGFQALKHQDRIRIRIKKTRRLTGSVDLDGAMRASHPNDPIWDYGIGVKQSKKSDYTVWIEPHPASSSHVDSVLAKLAWLRTWLSAEGAAFGSMTARYVWLATGSVALSPNSPKRRLIAERGLEFRAKVLDLDELI